MSKKHIIALTSRLYIGESYVNGCVMRISPVGNIDTIACIAG